MAIVVVGAGGRAAGKTALVCGLLRALPGFQFAAVKVTSHGHGEHMAIWEDTGTFASSRPWTDTQRFLAAGARRALLVTASEEELGQRIAELAARLGPQAHVIFESNRVGEILAADLCLAILSTAHDGAETLPKASFAPFLSRADALVAYGPENLMETDVSSAKQVFRLAEPGRVFPEMAEWVRAALRSSAERPGRARHPTGTRPEARGPS
jgi:hypothetical protein